MFMMLWAVGWVMVFAGSDGVSKGRNTGYAAIALGYALMIVAWRCVHKGEA